MRQRTAAPNANQAISLPLNGSNEHNTAATTRKSIKSTRGSDSTFLHINRQRPHNIGVDFSLLLRYALYVDPVRFKNVLCVQALKMLR